MATTQLAARPPTTAPAGAVPAVRALPRWPLFLIASPAAVAVWSGWVGLGLMCGFGPIHPLPGIADSFTINTAITLPVGVEAYGAYAMGAWLHPRTPPNVRKFARNSALGALALGMVGQVIYHLLAAAHATAAPWPVVMLVSCLPVLTLGFGGALTHLLRAGHHPAAVEGVPLVDGPTAAELRTEVDAVRDVLRTELAAEADAVRHALRTEVATMRGYADTVTANAARAIEDVRRSLRAEIAATRDSTGPEVSPPDRDALVAELADEMRDAIAAGDRWTPDYDALMTRTGYRRRWCESAVADARTLAFSAPRADGNPAPADETAPTDAPQAIAA
jgi:hypothetical protein